MHRDTKEALERLEAELLEDSLSAESDNTPEEEAELPEDLLDEDQLDNLLEDTQKFGPVEGSAIYKNYSNGYKIYNSDKTDRDPEDLSDELLTSRRDPVVTGLTILALSLLAAILGVLVWVLLTFRGIV